jgi:hypothetical protein
MDANFLVGRSFALQHRHNDGKWERLEQRTHHAPADHDPERDWERGRLFVCPSCEEQVRIVTTDGEAADAH